MRTPKRLYAQKRLIYQPELPTCPHCGEVLVMCNYLAWDKTVQTLDQVLSVASRPGRCPDETCPGAPLRLMSAQAQSIASPGSTYGYDVLVRIGWLRYQARATYTEIHRELASHVRISESHIRYLYQHLDLPLLACHERQHQDHLAQIVQAQGGLVIALDGLAPQAGEPQIWFIRELTSGLTLRSGWLSKQDQTTFEAFLRPLKQLQWPILAVLSDKQTGLMPAVRKVFPKSRYQFCQAHYLRNLAEPLADTDSAFKVDLRKAVRQPLQGEQVAEQLRSYLDVIRCQSDVSPVIYNFGLHLDKVSRSYWPGLFHCYHVPGLPRTHNEIESLFRDAGRQMLRITGQKGLTGRTLQRQGAWELLPRPATEAKLLDGLSQIPPEDLAQERPRFAQHRERFRMQSRSPRQTQIQFAQLRQRWAALPPTGTG